MEDIKFIHFINEHTIRSKGETFKVYRNLTIQVARETEKLYYFKSTDGLCPLYGKLIPVSKSREQIWDSKKMYYIKNPSNALFRISNTI